MRQWVLQASTGVALLLWAASAASQPGAPLIGPGGGVHFQSVLDPARLSLSHSYSFSLSSNRGRSSFQSLYVNSLHYRLSQDLSLRMDLGYATAGLPMSTERGTFLPHLRLSYQPDPRFLFQIDYGSALWSSQVSDPLRRPLLPLLGTD